MKPVRHSLMNVLLIAAVMLAMGLITTSAGADAPPTQLSYQGLVKVAGAPFSGTGYFKFAVVDAATGDGASYWLTGPETLTVSNGLFDFMLGSTTALPSSVFDNDPIYLRVWFSQAAIGPFQPLEPNQRIGSAAYALRAEHAATAGDAAKLGGVAASAYLTAVAGDARYPTKIELSDPGALNGPANPVDWTKLKSVPAGLADGVDDNTLGGLSCVDGQVAKYDGTAWACATDGNHEHEGSDIVSGKIDNDRLNMGSGNGLDADLLDGQQASAFQQHHANVVTVAQSGGDYTTISAALASITDASNSNRYLIKVMPGLYSERVTMKPYVDIEGAGELTTRITYTGSASQNTGTVVGASDAELRFLTVENTGGNAWIAIAIYNSAASPRLTHVTATASGGTSTFGVGVWNDTSSPVMTNVTVTASAGTGNNYGVFNNNSSPTIQHSTIVSGNTGILSQTFSGPATVTTVHNSLIKGNPVTISGMPNATIRVGASQLSGGVVSYTSCAGVYDENFFFYASTCPN